MKPKQQIDKVVWEDQFKIRPRRNASLKHEVIKLCLVLSLIEKFKKNLYWIRIYTEHTLNGGKICDVYFENIKTNEIIAYEIQNKVSEDWLKETQNFYEKWDKMFFKTDWVLIEEKNFTEDCEDIDNKIKEYI